MSKAVLCFNPLVAVIDDVFTDATAGHIIAQAGDTMARARVATASGFGHSEKRTNTQCQLDQWADPILTDVVTAVSSIVRLPPENCEPAMLLRYEGEQFFDVHHDAFDPNGSSRVELENGGQRVFTTLCYLNDVEDGGQTAFPELKISVKPRLGRVLLFSNLSPATARRHPDSSHIGLSVEKGEKWVLSLWWRERIYHKQRQFPSQDGPFVEI